MANELNIRLDPVLDTGRNVTARVRTAGGTQEGSDVTMTEVGAGFFTGNFSLGAVADGVYGVEFIDDDSGNLLGDGQLSVKNNAEYELHDQNDFDATSDTVANVTLVATTTTNTDMRGTDGANTTAPDNTGISNILVDTNELQTNQGSWLTATGFSTPSNVTDAQTAIQTDIGNLNNVSEAQVNVQVDIALADYDGPTKAELDSAVAPLATEANATINTTTITDAISDYEVANTPTEYVPDSAVRTDGDDEGNTYTALATTDGIYMTTGETTTGLEVEVTISATDITLSPTHISIVGFYNSNTSAHYMDVLIYNYTQSIWESKTVMEDRVGVREYIVPVDTNHHDGVTGEMKIKFLHNVSTYSTNHYLSLDSVRWDKIGSNATITNSLAQIINSQTEMDQKLDIVDVNVDEVLVDTDELQTNQGNWITADISGLSTFDSSVDEVITDTVSRDASKATGFTVVGDLAGLATESNATSNKNAIITEVDANETKIDSIQSDVTNVLADTNELQGNQGDWATADINGIETKVQADARQVVLISEHDTTQSAISNLNDVSATDVDTLLTTNHGIGDWTSAGVGGDSKEDIYNYFTTVSREDAFKADVSNLDVAVSSRLADADYVVADNATIGSINVAVSALNNISVADIEATTILAKKADVDGLNDLSSSDVADEIKAYGTAKGSQIAPLY